MHKPPSSKTAPVSTSQIGLDGWMTLLLSNFFILMSGSVTLIWMLVKVLRVAKETPSQLDKRFDLILVAGMKLAEEKPNPDYKLRLERARSLFHNTGSPILIMGGVTGKENYSEAAAGRDYLLSKDIDTQKVWLEDKSRNTLENFQNAKTGILQNEFIHYVMISNRYHLTRCQALANGLGLNPMLCAAEDNFTLPLSAWPRFLLEAYYLHWYYTGKIWSTLTNNQKSLRRIR